MPRLSGPVAVTALMTMLGLLAVACANEPSQAAPTDSSATSTVRIVCEANGSTTLLTPKVQVRRDGFTLHVRSDLDEPASINGLGMDVDPGASESGLTRPPGRLEVACWPFSEHTSPEPHTHTLTISDPERLYMSAELECPPGDDRQWAEILEVQSPEGSYRSPIDAAAAHLDGLQTTDDLRKAGYPEQQSGPVIVVREGAVVASVIVALAKDGTWYVAGANGCSSVQLT
jgi:hypothetical protein